MNNPTPMQLKSAEMWATGKSAARIGREIKRSTRTIESHLDGFKDRTECETKHDVFMWFVRNIWKMQINDTNPPGFDNWPGCLYFDYGGIEYTTTLPAVANIEITISTGY